MHWFHAEKIKQSDVVLLGFPLQMPMSRATRRNDLEIYENVSRDCYTLYVYPVETVIYCMYIQWREQLRVDAQQYNTLNCVSVGDR